MRPGDRVTHARHGPGTVEVVRTDGRVSVRFDAARELPWTVPAHELVVDGAEMPSARAIRVLRHVPPQLPLDAEHAKLRQVIEALRLGVVPASHLHEYTVGREDAVRKARELLRARQGMSLVFGDYGAGKTHFLELVEQEALEHGFVTSRVTLDQHETPLSHPQRLWRAIAGALRYPGTVRRGLLPLLECLEDDADHFHPNGRRFHRFLTPVLWAIRRKRNDLLEDVLLDYIEGQPVDAEQVNCMLRRARWSGPRLLALPDYRTYGRVYAYILGGVATWAADAGFTGACLLFDEAEQVDTFDRRRREFAYEVICHYAAASLPKKELLFDPEELYRGGQEVHRQLPLRFTASQPLVVFVALTPEPEIQLMCSRLFRHDNAIELSPLSPRSRGKLVGKVVDLYRRAYGLEQPPEPHLERPPSWYESPRHLVRELVAALDRERYQLLASRETA